MSSLVSTQNRVESPFIIVKIGEYTFGHCSKLSERKNLSQLLTVEFPNFMDSLDIVKINGAINTYTLRMVYGITETDDPNLLEKVFASISDYRELTLSYGDWNMPGFIYKEETAMITEITSDVDFESSKIVYTLKCTSSALSLTAGKYNFSARRAKPSTVIRELITDRSTGLLDVFYGMKDKTKLSSLIETDDKIVTLLAKSSITIFDYISYLVSCMTCIDDPDPAIKAYKYYWATYDDISNEYGGPYFKVTKVAAHLKYNVSYNTYSVDVGYPSSNYVTSFKLNNNETWAILYNYSKKINLPQYTYDVDNDGKIVSVYSPAITKSSKFKYTTETSKDWWSSVTQYPITAQLTIKGLLRPAILMSYVKINTFFYGKKHISSGLYMITKQQDTINSSGYKTLLTLTRISGDEEM